MPNQPKTPARSVRVGVDLWEAAKAKAAKRGETVTDVITQALWRYVKEEQVSNLEDASRDLVHHIGRMLDWWAESTPEVRNADLWAPLHEKADAVRRLVPSEAWRA